MHPKLNTLVWVSTWLALCSVSRADDLAVKGREILQKNQPVVVTVQMVVKAKMSMAGVGVPDNESTKELTGTVVDPSGLTVISLSTLDPGGMMQAMFATTGEEGAKFKMDTELSDIKILLDDGTDTPAEVVLRDQDLDLAFIRPKTKPASPMLAVDLTKPGQALVLDQVIALNRLGAAASRAYAASVERITAIAQKPRLSYIPDSTMTATSMGCPAFTLDGNFLGVFVTRTLKPQGGGGMMGMLNFPQGNFTSIILPAKDLLEATRQALEVKMESKAETEKK